MTRRELLLTLPASAYAAPTLKPDLILHHGNIVTMDATQPRAQAVAIAGGEHRIGLVDVCHAKAERRFTGVDRCTVNAAICRAGHIHSTGLSSSLRSPNQYDDTPAGAQGQTLDCTHMVSSSSLMNFEGIEVP